ncbi:MAG TPA: hypothetical protein VKE69_01860, partial [Planctomycetota bacterium]|nr:hypothetical protein [Planctomycetota bacterium]
MSPRRSLALLTAAAFLSGVAAIAYELLWLRRLGEIVGSTSQALAVVLAVLFAGMGAGGRIVGSVADRRGGAIAVFVLLETILAASGLLFLPASRVLESAVASGGGFSVLGVAALLKSLGAGALVVLPAAAMGGTVAALARHVVRRSADLAPRVGRLYGWNTLGAAAAALAVPYVAIAKLGVAGSFAAAASCNLLAAALAYAGRVGRDTPAPVAIEPTRIAGGRRVVLAAAALSGFLAIALEIAWTRALAARTRGTVYSFATILFVYLLAIALGSLIAARLARRGLATRAAYAILLVATGLATLATTHALRADDDARRFGDALSAALAMGLPMCLLGANFPFLVALAHRELGAVGREVGRVALFNSAGSAVAAIAATHVLLPWLGIETTIAAAAWAFVLGGSLFVLPWANVSRGAERSIQASTIVAALALTCLLPDDLRRWRAADGDRLLHYEEGVSASVAVVAQGPSDVVLKVDGDYRLGSTRTQFAQERQGLIPLLLHPEPSRVLMLGVGTGCSTGAVARYGNLAIDAAEILPEVLRALPGFDSINGSLLRRAQQDVKVRLLAADARVLVRAPGPPYDVAIGDLYVPWRAGEGAMYTREHFEAVRDRLATGGLFCQWLPLYQLGLGE